ncbi:hypothetical protein D3C81_1173330 [compost metagenome]
MLEHHADFAAHVGSLASGQGKVGVVDTDVALFGNFQAVDAADQCRFTRPGRPAQDDAFAFTHVEVDVAQHMEGAVVLVQALNGHHDLAWINLRGRGRASKAQ